MKHHLAQLNVGVLTAPLDGPQLADFTNNLPAVNAVAEATPGFVWRLTDAAGADATSLRPFRPDVLVNMSGWEALAPVPGLAFRSPHLEQLRRRGEFFRPYPDGPYQVLWWVPAGYLPT